MGVVRLQDDTQEWQVQGRSARCKIALAADRRPADEIVNVHLDNSPRAAENGGVSPAGRRPAIAVEPSFYARGPRSVRRGSPAWSRQCDGRVPRAIQRRRTASPGRPRRMTACQLQPAENASENSPNASLDIGLSPRLSPGPAARLSRVGPGDFLAYRLET